MTVFIYFYGFYWDRPRNISLGLLEVCRLAEYMWLWFFNIWKACSAVEVK